MAPGIRNDLQSAVNQSECDTHSFAALSHINGHGNSHAARSHTQEPIAIIGMGE